MTDRGFLPGVTVLGPWTDSQMTEEAETGVRATTTWGFSQPPREVRAFVG